MRSGRHAACAMAALTTLALAATAPRAIHAQDGPARVALLTFDGPGGKNIRNALVKKLSKEEGIDLVPRATFTEAADKLGIPETTTKPKNVVKLAEEAGVDASVLGTVTGKGKKTVTITVIMTRDPEGALELEYTYKGKKPPDELLVTMKTDVVAAIEEGMELEVEDEDEEYEEILDEETDEEEEEEEPASSKGKDPKKAEGVVIRGDVGIVVAGRALTVTPAAGPGYEYDGGAFPAFDLDIEFFPLRLVTPCPGAHLGLAFGFTHSFLLESRVQDTSDTSMDTKMVALDVRLLYELALSKVPLTLDFSAGWGLLQYVIERGDVVGVRVPSYEYMQVVLGMAVAWQILPRWLALEVGGDVYIPHAWGEAETAYGKSATGIGGTARLGLSGLVVAGLRWSVGFEYIGMRTMHDGSCVSLDACTMGEGDHSVDTILSGWFRVGYEW